jgi:hypothetical protein
MKPATSNQPGEGEAMLIAPCGMNCRLCRAFMRHRNPCRGCRSDDRGKPKTRVFCKIKLCHERARTGRRFCIGCGKFPCELLRRLDKRYRANCGMSMIDNLRQIQAEGLAGFLAHEKSKWSCPECGETICVHEPACLVCHRRWH